MVNHVKGGVHLPTALLARNTCTFLNNCCVFSFIHRTLLLVLSMIVEYCQCVDLMPMLTTDIMTRLFELMKVCE